MRTRPLSPCRGTRDSRVGGPFWAPAGLPGAAAGALAAAALALAALAPARADGPGTQQQPTPEPYVVRFTEEGLKPAILAVPLGSAVRWTNETSVVHGTTHVPALGQPVAWNSGDIEPDGGAFLHRFDAMGTYNYIDVHFANDVAYQGTVIVTTNDPTGTPLVPTAGPTPTDGPTATEVPPSPTPPPTPTPAEPTPSPVVLIGRLVPASVPECAIDAALRPCGDPSTLHYVRTDGVVDPGLFGRDVRLEGFMVQCDAIGAPYLWLSQASALPGGCDQPTATPSPTPTASPVPPQTGNLALGRPVTAKGPVIPGYEPESLTDGNPTSLWYSDHQVSWVYVDLGQPTSFNQVRLRWGYPYAERYGVYVWEEGAWRGKLVVDNAHGGEDMRTLTFTEAQYVMLYLMRSSVATGGFALAEYEIFGEPRPNWALGQPVVASSDQDGRIAAYATDGLPGTFWVSGRQDANPWIAIYLPASIELTEFRLYWTTAYPRNYSLVFFEGGQRTFSSPVELDFGGLHRLVGKVPVRADTLMVYAHQNAPEGYVGLQEIEIFGPGPREDDADVRGTALPVHAWLDFTPLSESGVRLSPGGQELLPGALRPIP